MFFCLLNTIYHQLLLTLKQKGQNQTKLKQISSAASIPPPLSPSGPLWLSPFITQSKYPRKKKINTISILFFLHLETSLNDLEKNFFFLMFRQKTYFQLFFFPYFKLVQFQVLLQCKKKKNFSWRTKRRRYQM